MILTSGVWWRWGWCSLVRLAGCRCSPLGVARPLPVHPVRGLRARRRGCRCGAGGVERVCVGSASSVCSGRRRRLHVSCGFGRGKCRCGGGLLACVTPAIGGFGLQRLPGLGRESHKYSYDSRWVVAGQAPVVAVQVRLRSRGLCRCRRPCGSGTSPCSGRDTVLLCRGGVRRWDHPRRSVPRGPAGCPCRELGVLSRGGL